MVLDGSEDDVSELNNLKKHLTILSEDTWFKDGNTMFLQEGIYEALLTNGNSITFKGELKGPLRILNSAISNKLHTTLKKSTAGIIFEDPTDNDYIGRVKNLLDIEEINSDSLSDGSTVESRPESDTDFPRNLILYGAPGTGKSYKLNQRVSHLNPHHFERVTFYSDYSYSQFVGGYRPVPVYIQGDDNTKIKNKSNEDLNRPGQPTIEYTFVPGPLLRMYVESKKNPENNYLLMIEELNRADAAAVFGDFFQLLDRKSDGTSEYQIQLSKEAEEYIKDNNVDGDSISLPSNLFIWASLNSADQGVFPIDTAFKRRWEFEYLPLNENEAVVDDCTITLAIKDESSDQRISISWNILRKKINQKLSDIGIQEDLMIGPFFLSTQEMRNDTAFKYKLLAYLRDDILRHQHHDFFSVKGTLDHLIKSYDNGENIFNFDLD